jgi:hypothetical protein
MNKLNKISIKKRRYIKKLSKKGGSSQNCIYDSATKEMKNVCPGLRYLNEIRETVGVQDPNSVYLIFGHGCDLDGEVLPVPENCEYYTTVACGITAEGKLKKLEIDFFNNTLDLDNPDKYNFINDSSTADETYPFISKTGEETLYRRVSGDTYVNSKNSLLLSVGIYGGLRKMGDIISDNMFNGEVAGSNNKYFIELDPNFSTHLAIIDRPMSLEIYYLQHFAGSVFPTTYQVCKLLHEKYSEKELNSYKYPLIGSYHSKFLKLINDTFSIDYASIMDVFKGIHINCRCRPICRGPSPFTREEIIAPNSFIENRRRVSSSPSIEWNESAQQYDDIDDYR